MSPIPPDAGVQPDELEGPMVISPDGTDAPEGTGGLLILLIVWSGGIAVLTAIIFGAIWLAEQFEIISGRQPSPAFALMLTLVYAVLITVPTLWAGRRIRHRRPKAVLMTWAAAGLFVIVCLPVRFVPVTAGQSGALLQIGCSLLFVLIARRLLPAPIDSRATPPYWTAVVAAATLALFWVLWGAFGSWLDSVLNLVAGLALGAVAAVIFRWQLLPTLAATSNDTRANIGLGGLAMGAALAIMGAGFGTSGQQLILMILLPSLGWLLMGIAYLGRGTRLPTSWAALGLAVGLVAAAPMILIDQEELLLILNLGTRDVGQWAAQATLVSAFVALLLGLAAILFARRLPNWQLGRGGLVMALASTGALAAVYLVAGRHGFHGERLFVIMQEQTRLEDLGSNPDYWQRRAEAYDILVGQSNRTQKEIRATLARLGIDYTPYYLVNALEVDGGPLVRLWLASQSEVDRILISPNLRPLPELPPIDTGTADRPTEPQWNLTSIGAPNVWANYGVTGDGIVIGQSDSGVELSHPELTQTYRGNTLDGPAGNDYNWFDPWIASQSPIDFGGHGTHTLGSIVGQSVGVAPGATWIACVNLERNLGNPALYLDCLQFLFAPFPLNGDPLRDGRPDLGAHVLNNSWGCPAIEGCDPGALLAAVRALRAAGVFVVASAGNEGSACGTVQSPIALYDEVFSVGAVDSLGQVASFSSRGPVTADGSDRIKPDLAAPGVDVLSSYPNGTYSISSGTSMAGPHVVGAVALLWSANPDLIGDIDGTEAILATTARPYDNSLGVPECAQLGVLPNNATGYGLVDAFAAVRAALEPVP